jgi:glutaredoxin
MKTGGNPKMSFSMNPIYLTSITKAAVLCAAVFSLQSATAQTVYRIVGADGKVTFSDKPPVTRDDKTTATGRGGKALDIGNSPLPYELSQVVGRYPVTLYTSSNCGPCGSARTLLSNRGIPFSERTVSTNEDVEALTRISGENSLPFLTIGGQKIKGFSDAEWTQYLDAAGYPSSSKLPATYRSPAPAPLVAIQKPEVVAPPARAAAAPAAPEPAAENTGSNPAGIRF